MSYTTIENKFKRSHIPNYLAFIQCSQSQSHSQSQRHKSQLVTTHKSHIDIGHNVLSNLPQQSQPQKTSHKIKSLVTKIKIKLVSHYGHSSRIGYIGHNIHIGHNRRFDCDASCESSKTSDCLNQIKIKSLFNIFDLNFKTATFVIILFVCCLIYLFVLTKFKRIQIHIRCLSYIMFHVFYNKLQ